MIRFNSSGCLKECCYSLLLGIWVGGGLLADELKWQAGDGFRHAPLTLATSGKPGFRLMSGTEIGVQWTNLMSMAKIAERQNLINGSGVAAGDFDGDGWCDLYFCSTSGPNVLYRNRRGWTFEDVTAAAGVGCAQQSSRGAVFADLNGDARLDLLVTSFTGPDACFFNLGNGRFTNVTAAAGLVSKGATTSMALGDVDGDGDLDLYQCHFAVEALLRDGVTISFRDVNGQQVVTGRHGRRLRIIDGQLIEFGEPDILYRNDGGRFTALRWEEYFQDEEGKPAPPPQDLGLAVQVRDINGDGYPDIYVCNDFHTPDRIWLNDGHGKFRALDRQAMRNMSYASMGVDFADVDRDGRLDFFVVEMLSRDWEQHQRQSRPLSPTQRTPGVVDTREQVARNTFYWNRGDGTYAEIAWFGGLAASDWSWTPIFLDVDLDGYEDILVSNGHLRDVNHRDTNERRAADRPANSQPARSPLLEYPRLDTPNAAFRNQGNLTFTDVTQAWGFDSTEISHGMAVADLDNDGDLDVVVNAAEVAPLFYRNEGGGPRVAVRLKGRSHNVQGIGAQVRLIGGAVPVQQQEILSGGRYLSGDDPMRVFAAGTAPGPMSIEVQWRNGAFSKVTGVQANRVYEIDETRSVPRSASSPTVASHQESAKPSKWFEALGDEALPIQHAEDADPDFARQPLLPRKLGQSGPAMGWIDLDADGRSELIMGSSQGGRPSVFRNTVNSSRWTALPVLAIPPLSSDVGDFAGWIGGGGVRSVFLSGLGRADFPANEGGIVRLDWNAGGLKLAGNLPGVRAGAGPCVAGDVDGDGDLDLFVGGRWVPGRYPESADSHLFRNENGRLVEQDNERALFRGLGMVVGASFTDLNGDGFVELVLACEWGPVRVFANQEGQFKDATQEWGLQELTGLWTCVQSGDFDGDGRVDLVVGNRGLNTFYQRFPKGPWHLFAGEFNGDGVLHPIEAATLAASGKPVPLRDLEALEKVLPWLRSKFPTHAEFSQMSVQAVLGERFALAKEWRAATLASVVLLNRGSRFEVNLLPAAAQWTPIWSLRVADFDLDGNQDVFATQNEGAVRDEDDRMAAGLGLVMAGNGAGSFRPLASSESGIVVFGDQRGAAIGDWDEDGKLDLVVGQNAGRPRLFRNQGVRKGISLLLRGPALNPEGIGCSVQVEVAGKLGPMQEVRGSGGGLGGDAPGIVVAAPSAAAKVHVRWPGGKKSAADLPAGVETIEISAPD